MTKSPRPSRLELVRRLPTCRPRRIRAGRARSRSRRAPDPFTAGWPPSSKRPLRSARVIANVSPTGGNPVTRAVAPWAPSRIARRHFGEDFVIGDDRVVRDHRRTPSRRRTGNPGAFSSDDRGAGARECVWIGEHHQNAAGAVVGTSSSRRRRRAVLSSTQRERTDRHGRERCAQGRTPARLRPYGPPMTAAATQPIASATEARVRALDEPRARPRTAAATKRKARSGISLRGDEGGVEGVLRRGGPDLRVEVQRQAYRSRSMLSGHSVRGPGSNCDTWF